MSLKEWCEKNIEVEKISKDKVAITCFESYSENFIHYGTNGSFLVIFSIQNSPKELLFGKKLLDKLNGDEVLAIKQALVDLFAESYDSYQDFLAEEYPIYKGGLKFSREIELVIKTTPEQLIKLKEDADTGVRMTKTMQKEIEKIEKSLNKLKEELQCKMS